MRVTIEPTSRVIAKVVYDGTTYSGYLTVHFHNGSAYEYKSVLLDEFVALFGADEPSVGEWYNDRIKPHHEFEKLELV